MLPAFPHDGLAEIEEDDNFAKVANAQ